MAYRFTPGDKIARDGKTAIFKSRRPDGELDVYVIPAGIGNNYDAIWPDSTEITLVAPATEQAFDAYIRRVPNCKAWEREHGRKPTLADAATSLDDQCRFIVAPPKAAAPPESTPVVHSCLECGATYAADEAHLIEAGGMGCARCNH